MGYFRWKTELGVQVHLVESEAKLLPLDKKKKKKAVKAEVCGEDFASWLRKWIENPREMEIDWWFHLLESQTVLGEIQRDSNVFFVNKIREIQKIRSVEDWWWITEDLNMADIIIRGATPADLQKESV